MRSVIARIGFVFVLTIAVRLSLFDVCAATSQASEIHTMDIPKFLDYEFGGKQLFSREYKETVALREPFGPFKAVTLYFNCDKELESLEFCNRGSQSEVRAAADFCEKYFHDNYGIVFRKCNNGSLYTFEGTNVSVDVMQISSATCACVIENKKYAKEVSLAQILSNYDPNHRAQLEIGAKRFGRTALEQMKYERDMPMPKEFCGFEFGSKEYYLPSTNYIDRFKQQRKSDASRRKITLKEKLCGIGDAELEFTEDGELYSVVLEAEYKDQPAVDLRDLTKEIADIFARKYNVVCIEDKVMKSFSFWRKDFHLYIEVQSWKRGVRVSASASEIARGGRQRAAERKKARYANLAILGLAGLEFGSTNFVGATMTKTRSGYLGTLNMPYGLLSQVEIVCGSSGFPKVIRLKTNGETLTSRQIRDEESRIAKEFTDKYGIEFGRNLSRVGAPMLDYHFTSDNYRVYLYGWLKGYIVLEVEDRRIK